MDVREKLVELLDDIQVRGEDFTDYEIYGMRVPDTVSNEDVASHLIAHGVTVQEWYSASNPPKEDGTYLVQTNTGTITTARFYAFKSFPATKYLPACHRSASWQSNRNVVKWTYLPQPPKGE